METPKLDLVSDAVLEEIRNITAIIEPNSEIKTHLNIIWALVNDSMYWAAEADYGTNKVK